MMPQSAAAACCSSTMRRIFRGSNCVPLRCDHTTSHLNQRPEMWCKSGFIRLFIRNATSRQGWFFVTGNFHADMKNASAALPAAAAALNITLCSSEKMHAKTWWEICCAQHCGDGFEGKLLQVLIDALR